MAIVSGDILRTSVNFTLEDGTQYQNVYHHQRAGVGVFTDQEHVDALKSWAQTVYNTIAAHVSDTIIEALSSVDKVEYVAGKWTVTENVGTFTPTFTPTGSTDTLPNQIAPYLIFKTSRPKTVGRKFLFPFLETSQDAGVLTSAAMVVLNSFAAEAMTYISLAAENVLIPGVVRTAVDAWHSFYAVIANAIVGTQRRRRPGVGG